MNYAVQTAWHSVSAAIFRARCSIFSDKKYSLEHVL